MNTPTADELRERYREMDDDQLLALAAEPGEFIAGAAAILREEMERRGLSAADVAETQSSLEKAEAMDKAIQRALFDPRVKLHALWEQLVASAAIGACWLVSASFARLVFRSPKVRFQFEMWSWGLFALACGTWQIWSYLKRRGGRRAQRGTMP